MFSWVCCLKTWKPKVSLIKFVKKLVLLVKSSIVPLLTTTQLLDDTMVATSGPMDTFRKMDTRVSAWVELLKQGWHWRGNQSSKTIPVDERKPLLRFFVACFSRRNRSDSDGSLIASQCLICMLQEPCWWNTGLKQRYPATGISPTVTFTRCRWSLLSQSRNLVTGARRNGVPKAQMAWCCFFNTYSIIILYHDKRNNDDMRIQRERRQCIHIMFIQRRYGISVPIWVMRFSKDRFLRAWKQRWDLFNQLRWWRDWSSCFLVVQMDIRSVGTRRYLKLACS